MAELKKFSTQPKPTPSAVGTAAPHAAPMGVWTLSFQFLALRTPAPNPEQLFAAGWSACFISAIALVAK